MGAAVQTLLLRIMFALDGARSPKHRDLRGGGGGGSENHFVRFRGPVCRAYSSGIRVWGLRGL